jgi:hypothetical protein
MPSTAACPIEDVRREGELAAGSFGFMSFFHVIATMRSLSFLMSKVNPSPDATWVTCRSAGTSSSTESMQPPSTGTLMGRPVLPWRRFARCHDDVRIEGGGRKDQDEQGRCQISVHLFPFCFLIVGHGFEKSTSS